MKRHNNLSLRALVGSLLILAVVAASGGPAGAQDATDDSQTLRAAALLFRHSVISPKYSPPKVDTEWPMGFKQLTAVGMVDMYQRGQALRQRYVDELGLLSPSYHLDELYVRASNTDRSLQSAQMLILGLYPLGTGPDPAVYDANLQAAPAPGLAFTPVPIHSVALENDSVLRPWTGTAKCEKYRKYVKGLSKTALYRDQGRKYEAFLRRMSEATGVNEGEKLSKILYKVNEIYEPLSANVQHNIPLPASVSQADMDLMGTLADWNYHYQFLGKKVGQLTGGPFVGEVASRFQEFVKTGGQGPRLSIYSGHQRTMLGLEAALGIETQRTDGALFEGRVPPLGSHYAFELHETAPGQYAVQTLFISDESERVIEIPGCDGKMCSLDRFLAVADEITPKNWRKACSA
jgi:acid phosphatase